MAKHWSFLPSSGPSGHLLPKGEGLPCYIVPVSWRPAENGPMADLDARIAGLSPQKRELLLRLLEKKKRNDPNNEIRRLSREGNTFPLSYAQQRLWFLDQMEPGSSYYNWFQAVTLNAPIDVSILERALNAVARRHEILRTTFVSVDGRLMQVIAPALTLPLTVIDLSGLPETERGAETVRRITEETARPFDLGRGPLVRALLFRVAEEEH